MYMKMKDNYISELQSLLKTLKFTIPETCSTSTVFFFVFGLFLKISLIYSRKTQREREAETQAEGEAGSLQGADWAWIPGPQDHARAKGRRHSTTEPPRHS